MKLRNYLVFALIGVSTSLPITNWNLFNPYDILLLPPAHFNECAQAWVAGEFLVGSVSSYQAALDEFGSAQCFRKHADPLQLFQDEQDSWQH